MQSDPYSALRDVSSNNSPSVFSGNTPMVNSNFQKNQMINQFGNIELSGSGTLVSGQFGQQMNQLNRMNQMAIQGQGMNMNQQNINLSGMMGSFGINQNMNQNNMNNGMNQSNMMGHGMNQNMMNNMVNQSTQFGNQRSSNNGQGFYRQ